MNEYEVTVMVPQTLKVNADTADAAGRFALDMYPHQGVFPPRVLSVRMTAHTEVGTGPLDDGPVAA